MKLNQIGFVLLLVASFCLFSCSGTPFWDNAPQNLQNVLDTVDAVEQLVDDGNIDAYDYIELVDMVSLLREDLDALLNGYRGLTDHKSLTGSNPPDT